MLYVCQQQVKSPYSIAMPWDLQTGLKCSVLLLWNMFYVHKHCVRCVDSVMVCCSHERVGHHELLLHYAQRWWFAKVSRWGKTCKCRVVFPKRQPILMQQLDRPSETISYSQCESNRGQIGSTKMSNKEVANAKHHSIIKQWVKEKLIIKYSN